MTKLFIENNADKHAISIARLLPNGKAWIAKNNPSKNMYKLLLGLGFELLRFEESMNEVFQAYDFVTDDKLLEEWENLVGIPDDCLEKPVSTTDRVNLILLKLNMHGVSTSTSFEDLAAVFGITVRVSGGARWGIFPMEFPLIFFEKPKGARFTIVVDFLGYDDFSFKYTFPIVFGDIGIPIVKCLFNKLKPANTDIIYRDLT